MTADKPVSVDAVVELLECYNGHGSKAVSINGFRLLGKKCCGRWKTVRRWKVPRAALERDFTRALEISYSEDTLEPDAA